ncbi:RagB/SusD family nutrient uptake outer membrane protein [Nonlabens antarcticus]|uniref:RagB/SusD family nutrient uptake outer membrane protein n=1 Tax=Nonlabens antarcticus TaxID=392714 RepID=UPI001890D0F9|nr:RagB/SusD family nutrient uptake outer membrane protein [Nonlabens antarcticus]
MKNIKNNIQILVFAAIAFIVSSCSMDDIQPINQLVSENAIRDEASAQQVLNGVYDLGREFDVSGFPIYVAAYGNEGVINGFLSGGSTPYNTNNIPVTNRYLTNLYNGLYKIVNQTNFLIEELEAGKAVGIEEDRKNIIISEAKFQRALTNFYLLRYFGQFYDLNSNFGIVLSTNFSTELESKPRGTVKEAYDLIAADLEFAAQNGPKSIEHFYSGSTAARALLSKVELYRGNYDIAASLALEVINNTDGYSLESNYQNIFINKSNSSEVLFAPFTGPGAEGGTQMSQVNRTTYSETLRSIADNQVGTGSDGSLSGVGSGYDARFSYAYSGATKGVKSNGKYPYNDFTNSENNTLYHLRLGEIYLVHAEAEARRTGGDLATVALGSLNTIRNRAGATDKVFTDKATLLEDIRQEKLLELFFENGEPYYDLVRYDQLGDISAAAIKPTLTTKDKFIFPYTTTAITGNNALIQNPGY